MAEGFVLNISKEMLSRLDAADKKIVQIGESAEKAMKKINEAFGKKLTGVEDFIKQLNDIQQQLSKKDLKVNVDLALKNGSLDSLKKQIEALGITIPVGVTATGTGGSNSAGAIPNGLNEALSRIATTIDAMNKTLASVIKVQPTSFTPQQQGALSKKASTAAYREQINAIQQVIYAEKEKARVERENDKKAQIAHRERMTQLQQQEREIMRLAKTYRSMPSSINYVGGLIHESKQATTVNQMITAIRNLKNAKKDLDTTDSRYQKNVQELNKEIRRQESELRKLGHQLDNVNKRSRNLFDITGQLGRALSLMFSVSQITQYVSKMVNVRKEMELQQRSLQVLLQNKDKANELWNQTLDLAVKSPFRVKELVTYTKQLAAYRIESDKLFETNKMLADVSAGLGVDMQRLILAFGQVKSASFLRGTELRQFTEAGIPMLEELSKYFSEIYGKSVSVAEVFDMISKRMVTFTDVEKVFQRMTGAGGVFFNMQEELSQTTAGLISNLQDSIDLMFNEIGKKNQGLINDVIKAARYLVDNWETVGKVMKGALVTLLLYKAATMDISKITKGWGANVKAAFSLLKENPLEFFQTFKGNIMMTALTAIIALVIKAVREHNKYKRAIEEVNKAHEKFRKSVSDVELGFSEMFQNGNDNIDEYRDKLQELIGIAKQSYNIEIDFKVNELETIDEVSRKFDDLKEKILSFNQLSLEFSLDFVERDDRGWEWFQDYLGTDLNQLSESQKSISRIFYEMRTNMSSALKEYYKYKRTAEKFVPDEIFESFSSQDLDTETSYDFFKRNVQAINNLLNKVVKLAGYTSSTALQIAIDNDDLSQTKYEDISNILKQYSIEFETQDKLIGFINNLIYKYNDYESKLGEATKELTAFYQTTNDDISLLVAELEKNENLTPTELNKRLSEYIYNAIKNIATTKELDPLVLDEMLSQAEKYYKEQEQFGFELDLLPKIKPVESLDLIAWQKAYNDEVDEILNTLTSKEDKAIFLPLKIRTDLQGVATTKEKQRSVLNEAIDNLTKEIEQLKIANDYIKQQYDNNEITLEQYNDLYEKNIAQTENYVKHITHLRNLVGGDDDKSKGGKDTATQRIKDQISLIRQLYEEYQKLTKEMGATKAFDTVMSSYKRSINNLFGSTLKVLKETSDSFEDWIKEVLVAREDVITKLAKDLGDESKFLVGAGVNLTREELKDFGLTVEDLINGISVDKAWEISNKKIEEHKKKLDDVLATYSELELTDVQYNELFDITWQGGAGNVKKFLNIIEQGEESLREYLESINGIDIVNKVGNEWVKTGKKVEIDINQQIDDFKNATTHAEKMAVALRYYLVTLKENPFGEKAKVTMKGLLNRAMDRATSVGGSKSTQIIKFEDLIDFTNKQGVLNSLKSLESQAKAAGEDAYNAYLKAFGETSVELELMFYIDERNKFENQIKDMFSDYELSLELDKLNIPKNLASQLFGVDTVDLDEIKTALQNKLNDLDSADISLTQQLQDKDIDENLKQSLLLQQKGNKQLREQTEANLRKISDMEQKELEERLKTYTKYLLNEQHERVKIRMETLRMLQEVKDTKEYTPAQRQTITDKIKEEERKKLAQQTWKDFEQSPMYMQMFDDVENMGKGALESLITQMGTLKDELQSMGLPASDLKEVLGAINKAEEELERRNPFKNFAKNAEIAFNRVNKIRQLEEQRANQQEVYENTKSTYDKHQDLLAQEEKKLESLNKGSDEYKKQLAWVELLRITTNNLAKSVNTIETKLSDTNNQINNINDSSNDFYKQLQNVGTISQSVSGGIWQIADAIHGLPEETKETLDYLGKLEQGITNIVGGILRIIYEDKIAGIAQLVDGLFSTVALAIDYLSGARKANKEAERQSRILSDLQNKYDRLNEAIDEAWNTQQIKEYNAELEKNLQQQIAAQKQIVAAYEDMKGADKVGSVEWERLQEAQDELQNLYDMQQDLQDNIYEKITGGIIDNTLDAISSWVDAWYDAFKETGDGLKGLEDNFNEMLLNLVKRQAVMKVAGRFIDQWNSVLERYVNNDDNLSLGEITSWANMIEQDLPALSSQLETFFKAFDGILGDTQGNLSGLQRGIHQLTESTGTELASYLNSIRFIVSDSNAQLRLLVSAQTGATTRSENPMVEQLRVIAQQTSAINTLLNSLTAPHPTQSGRGLKVVI